MNEDKCHLQKDNPNSGPANGLDRRDFLHGVAAVPVLGLFGYAVHKERVFQRAQTAAKLGATAPAGNLPELNVALIGAGAQGSVLLDAMLKIPSIRFACRLRHLDRLQPQAGDQSPGQIQIRGQRLRRLPRDAGEGEGPRRGRHRNARLLAQPANRGLSEGRDCTSTAKKRCPTRWKAPGTWCSRPAKRASCCRSDTSVEAIPGIFTAMRSSSRRI